MIKNRPVNFILKCILLTLSFWLVEIPLNIIVFEFELFFKPYNIEFWHINKAFLSTIGLNVIRLVFYYPIYIAIFILLICPMTWVGGPWKALKSVLLRFVTKIAKNNKVLRMAVINCGLYIFLSLLYGFLLMPETKEYFAQPFFYYFVLSTFVSPFILNYIPYYKKLIKEL